ncbi:hypothetical protein HNY73_011324 [Argiope bruennichi]|uniref:Peptidase aspartic putative domain-containing protein n=1 Tax=Argiope bruennichi TaxID=94029 RepID=A0A8T0F4Q3_ARGBR|nr:hypothetical protein HNY73_011324 [Argiope bruennichi]
MEREALIQRLKPIRASFTRICNGIKLEIEKENPDEEFIRSKLTTLERLSDELRSYDIQILDSEYSSEEQFNSEWESVEEYKEKLDLIKVKVEMFFSRQIAQSVASVRLNLLEQLKICGPVTSLQPGPWIEEMKQKGITVSDVGRKDLKIEILIGADVAGALLTGKVHKLENGLVAVESLLGWTVMGRINYYTSESNVSMSSLITSMLVHSSDIENLWKLEALGITDSKENRSDVELQEAVWDHFHKTLKRSEDRYEISLPWINEKDKLPSNREVAKKD